VSIQAALSILEDLISQNSGRHLVIIDGFDILCSSEDPVLADHLMALLNILMSIKRKGNHQDTRPDNTAHAVACGVTRLGQEGGRKLVGWLGRVLLS
jgi:hypothetical protein